MKTRHARRETWAPEEMRIRELETLEQRLTDGYLRIEDGQRRGADIMEWEEFWIDLLHQYEQLSDQLQESAETVLAA